MNNLGLYLTSVFIWGSTWFAITFQLGRVPVEVSVAYRFALASALLFAWCALRRVPLVYSKSQHAWMALQGALLFGLNYVLVYLAEEQISSGLVALIFSMITFANIASARVFLGTPVRRSTVVAATLGVAGVGLVLWPELGHTVSRGSVWLGAAFALLSTLSASLGNIAAARNQRTGMPVMQANAWSMLYGAVLVGAYALFAGREFTFEATTAYIGSLVYLALFGSVVAFGAYLTLVSRIGADRAGYVGAMVPIVAVVLSTLFEGLRWHAATFAGIALCVVGNVLVLRTKSRPSADTVAPRSVPSRD